MPSSTSHQLNSPLEKPALEKPVLGIIGGSGLYDMAALKDVETQLLQTPYGMPSDEIAVGSLHGIRVAFLPRHGKGHRLIPSEVPYRANVWALKQLGVEFVLSVSAVGSMKEEIPPGDLVFVDQFIDRTVGRERTFFGEGMVGHISFADPVCETLRQIAMSAAKKTSVDANQDDTFAVVDGGTYVCIEGPTFSTRAESNLFRSWGVDVIGMTNLPEARLVREAGMSYATCALSTDYDCWHEEEEDVSVEAVIEVLRKNVKHAQTMIENVARSLAHDGPKVSPYSDVAKFAVMTARDNIPTMTRHKAQLLFGDVLG
ncbi:MAG: S-methyl-5'-thioadenosine phosphorylase [Deltaproteobacteria bacterium]|nr:S-methyl-5'-thioadenosine phosphorylase [Deltaproteobacteria bacterium]